MKGFRQNPNPWSIAENELPVNQCSRHFNLEKALNAGGVTVADTVAEQTLSDPGYGESKKTE